LNNITADLTPKEEKMLVYYFVIGLLWIGLASEILIAVALGVSGVDLILNVSLGVLGALVMSIIIAEN
jgi:hypothetical protein